MLIDSGFAQRTRWRSQPARLLLRAFTFSGRSDQSKLLRRLFVPFVPSRCKLRFELPAYRYRAKCRNDLSPARHGGWRGLAPSCRTDWALTPTNLP